MNDLAFIALALKGAPLTTAELHEAVAAAKSIRSLANQMSTDQRLQRVGAESWGLVEWGGEAFTSIRDAILARVPVGESVHISELVADIAVRFGVAESSVRTYASAWPLKSVKGMVSRQEELVTPQGRPFPRSKGAFVTPDGFAFRTAVTVDHLRGSGSQFPTALAVALGGSIGSSLFFDSAAGLGKIRIGWNGSQATISTIKAELEALGAKVGDEFAVFFRSSKVEVRILPPSTGHPYGDLGRLCLIPPSNEVSRINVAKALGLDETSVWDEIRQSASARKDPELITAVNGVIELLRKPV
jgi:DNA polymerase-3 subunit epsilon